PADAGDLQIIGEVDARVRVHGAIAEVERRDELRVRQQDQWQRLRDGQGREVRERKLALYVVRQAGDEVLAEAPIEPDGAARLDVADDRLVRVGVGLDEHRID